MHPLCTLLLSRCGGRKKKVWAPGVESLLPLQHWGPHHLCERALQLPGGQREGKVSGGAEWLRRAPLRRMMWHQHSQKGASSPGQVYTLPKGSEQVQVYHRGNPRASVRLRSEYRGGGAGKKAQKAQLVPHTWCEPPTGVSLRAPQTTLCAPSVAGGSDRQEETPHSPDMNSQFNSPRQTFSWCAQLLA